MSARVALACVCALAVAACGGDEAAPARAENDGIGTLAGTGATGGFGAVGGAGGASGFAGAAGFTAAGGFGASGGAGGDGGGCADSASCCAAPRVACNGACVDLQSDALHCGACGSPCSGGQLCNTGSCACPAGQLLCGGVCIDPQMSVQHCGGCGVPCEASEMCMAGTCRGMLGPDGCADDALGVTIREIDSYQSVKVPIMQGGQAVTFFQRNADIIAGHDALFRISVTVDPGFVARELSARVTLLNAGSEEQYFAKQRISGSSRDEDSSSTFQVPLPAEQLRMDTRYKVELVECGAGSGTLRAPRFPASGDAELEPLTTGVVKIAVVPVRANSHVPDTSAAALQVYRDYFMAMYPITGVELTVASEISTGYPIDWSNLLDQIRDKRAADSPPDDVFYYGWVKATDTYEQFCSGACTLGIGYVVTSSTDVESRAAVGIAFADEGSAWTMAHEVAHNHGRNHAPCGANANLDGNFPYDNGGAGVWGYDARREVFLDPGATSDLMGYCNPKWISDYTFQGIANRIAAIHGTSPALSTPVAEARWQVLLLDSTGPRWGRQYRKPGRPFGAPEPAEVLDASGAVIEPITAYRTAIGHDDAVSLLVPEQKPGWHSVRLQGAHGAIDVPFARP